MLCFIAETDVRFEGGSVNNHTGCAETVILQVYFFKKSKNYKRLIAIILHNNVYKKIVQKKEFISV